MYDNVVEAVAAAVIVPLVAPKQLTPYPLKLLVVLVNVTALGTTIVKFLTVVVHPLPSITLRV